MHDAKTAVALARCLRAVYQARQSAIIPSDIPSVSSDASFLHKVIASVMDLLRRGVTHDSPSTKAGMKGSLIFIVRFHLLLDMLPEYPMPMKTGLNIQKLKAVRPSKSKQRIRRSPRDSS